MIRYAIISLLIFSSNFTNGCTNSKPDIYAQTGYNSTQPKNTSSSTKSTSSSSSTSNSSVSSAAVIFRQSKSVAYKDSKVQITDITAIAEDLDELSAETELTILLYVTPLIKSSRLVPRTHSATNGKIQGMQLSDDQNNSYLLASSYPRYVGWKERPLLFNKKQKFTITATTTAQNISQAKYLLLKLDAGVFGNINSAEFKLPINM